jgi:flavorubredoxin
MKIGIMVHSQTGNTLSVAEKIQERLSKEGHSAEMKKIIPFRESDPRPQDVQFQAKPPVEGYEALIFAAPVWGFSLSTVMRAYLDQMELSGKPIVLGFVTHAFPLPWMGGTRAIRQMASLCQAKGLKILSTGVINWSRKDREKQILDLTEQFVKALAQKGDVQ